MGDDDIPGLHIPDDWATAGEGGDDGSRSRSGWYTGGAISNCSARRGHLPDSESCHSATRGDWRIPPTGAGAGHSQRQPDPAFGATSKRDPPVQAHLSSVPATPESSGAGTGDVPYQGPGSDRVRDRCANPSAAWVMWITASDHITMWIATSYRPHLPGPRPPWGSNRRPSRNLLASNDGRMVCNRQRNLPGKSTAGGDSSSAAPPAAVGPFYVPCPWEHKGQVSPKCRRRVGRGAAAGYNGDSHSPPGASNYDHPTAAQVGAAGVAL